MTEPMKQKTANQVDYVLQGYLDQLLVTATETLTVVDAQSVPEAPCVTSVADTASLAVAETVAEIESSTPERVANAVIQKPKPAVKPQVASTTDMADKTTYAEPQALARTLTVPLPEVAIDDISKQALQAETDVQQSAMIPQTLDWRSSQGVECLIFKVAGLKLAIPLSVLGGVHNASDKITPLFGQASWSLGVWQSDEQKLTIVDSAQLIMPERGISLNDQGFSFVIQLDRSHWALACQEICDTITLVYDSIKWRGDNSKRPWLAGTVIDEMCALIDVPNLMGMLEDNTRSA